MHTIQPCLDRQSDRVDPSALIYQNRIRKRNPRRSLSNLGLAAFFLALTICNADAIDNPDTLDLLGQFRTQAQPYEAAINEETDGKSIAEARGKYLQFLDDQLNEAYRALLAKLPVAQQEQLRQSQKMWLRYRDAESTFIDANWTPAQFGSSSTISRHDYRTSIIRDRIEQLLSYLKNY